MSRRAEARVDQSKRDLFHNRPRILVVEDDLGTRYAYERHLRSQGINTTIASNAREALVLLDALEVDGVILDLKLPDMRGEAVLQVIRGRRGEDARVPVVVVTGAEAARDEGADARFDKPAAADAVCAKILQLVFRA